MIGDALHLDKSMMLMNRSAPVNRRSLLDYLEGGDPFFTTRDGARCEIAQSELEMLGSMCTEIEKMRLRLPIMVSTDCSGEGTSWKVEGVTETSVIARLLARRVITEDHLRFFNPDLKKLRDLLPTCTVITFIP